MGRLGNISGKEATNAFGKAGWQVIGQVGSHVVMTKSGVRANLSIPQHKELSTGTLRALIRAAGMDVEEILALLLKHPGSPPPPKFKDRPNPLPIGHPPERPRCAP